MTRKEWGLIAASILAAWPASPWPDGTVAFGWKLMEAEEFEAARRAVLKLARTGREYAPPPSVVYDYTRAEAVNTRLALPQYADPEVREMSDEAIADRSAHLEEIKRRLAASKAMP